MENQEKQPGAGFAPKDGFDLFMTIAEVHAAAITPLIRHSFGQDRPGGFGLAALLVMLCYAESTRSRAVLLYVAVWLAAIVANRIRTWWLVRRGSADHSRYNGYPWLVIGLPFVKTERTAKALEPLLCLFAGAALTAWSPPLGHFVAAGMISLTVLEGVYRMKTARRVVAMRNARIEMEQTADFYRRGGDY